MKSVIPLLFFISSFLSPGYGQLVFQNASTGKNDFLFSTLHKENGGFLSLGYTDRFGAGEFDFYLMNIDEWGNILWTKSFGGLNIDLGYSIVQAKDNGFILVGTSQSFGAGGADILLVKIDLNGELIWSKTYGGIGWDDGFELTPTVDGGYIIAGRTNSFGKGDGDIYCIKIDSLGNVLWNTTYGGVKNEDAQQIKQTNDNGYIVVGHTASFGAGNTDIYLVKTDSLGNVEWTKTYGGLKYDYGNSVQQTFDGGYIVSGHTNSFGFDKGEVLLLKLDDLGNIIWSKTYGGSKVDYSHYVLQNPAGEFVITGQTNSFREGGFDAYIIKVNSSGDPLWAMAYGGFEDDFSNAIEYIPSDKGYIIVGNSWSFGNQSRAYIIRTDSMGNSGCNEFSITINIGNPTVLVGTGGFTNSGINTSDIVVDVESAEVKNGLLCTTLNTIEEAEVLDYEVFPNPFSVHTILRTNSLKIGNCTFLLYDVNGQLVQEKKAFFVNQIEIKRNNLSSGLYFFKLISEDLKVITGKFLIQ